MKPNPKNFEPFIDPNGGEWIKMKSGKYKDVVWRPTDIKVDDHPDGTGDGLINLQAEFLGEAPKDFETFEKVAGSVITDILKETIANYENSDSNSSKD